MLHWNPWQLYLYSLSPTPLSHLPSQWWLDSGGHLPKTGPIGFSLPRIPGIELKGLFRLCWLFKLKTWKFRSQEDDICHHVITKEEKESVATDERERKNIGIRPSFRPFPAHSSRVMEGLDAPAPHTPPDTAPGAFNKPHFFLKLV